VWLVHAVPNWGTLRVGEHMERRDTMAERIGTVFIAADADPEGVTVMFHGYWDGGESVLEQMPETDKAVDAIRWGLDRTNDVRIRFDGWTYFWAGVGSPPAGQPGFGGTVVLGDQPFQ
jgi:hypothetical protein